MDPRSIRRLAFRKPWALWLLGGWFALDVELHSLETPGALEGTGAPVLQAEDCRERARSFRARNEMSPSQRRRWLERCLRAAALAQSPALALDEAQPPPRRDKTSSPQRSRNAR